MSQTATTEEKSQPGQFFVESLSLLNNTRLGLVENDMSQEIFSKFFNHDLQFIKLPKYFGLFSLIYFPRLFYNGYCVWSETIHDPDKSKPFFTRLKENLHKDRKRASMMANDFTWGTLNLACLIVNPFASMILTIAGVTFDVIHQCVLFGRDIKHYFELKHKQKTLQELKQQHAKPAEIQQKQQEINAFKQKYNLPDDMNHLVKDRLSELGLVVLFSVGCAMTFFPPTAVLGAALLTISLVFGAGRLLSDGWDFISKWTTGASHKNQNEMQNVRDDELAMHAHELSSHAKILQHARADNAHSHSHIHVTKPHPDGYCGFANEHLLQKIKAAHHIAPSMTHFKDKMPHYKNDDQMINNHIQRLKMR